MTKHLLWLVVGSQNHCFSFLGEILNSYMFRLKPYCCEQFMLSLITLHWVWVVCKHGFSEANSQWTHTTANCLNKVYLQLQTLRKNTPTWQPQPLSCCTPSLLWPIQQQVGIFCLRCVFEWLWLKAWPFSSKKTGLEGKQILNNSYIIIPHFPKAINKLGEKKKFWCWFPRWNSLIQQWVSLWRVQVRISPKTTVMYIQYVSVSGI